MEILRSRAILDYPLYACEFDPEDASRLIVAGGGGASRTGVGNKITLLSTSSQDPEIHKTSEIELSKDEDNVTCLAVSRLRRGKAALVYAGVNSGPEELKKGKNEHFRVFAVGGSTSPTPKIAELARASLFSNVDADTYQRLLRLAPPLAGASSSAQVGACSTGLSKEPEIVVFDVAAAGSPAPKQRGRLDLVREAVDLDIIQTGPDAYQLCYCDDYQLFLANVSKGATEEEGEPRLAYTMTADEWAGSTVRPAFRTIRYLSPDFILAAANLPKRSGVVIVGFRLLEGKARVAVSTRLPKSVGQTTGMAVRNLSPPATPPPKSSSSSTATSSVTAPKLGDTQFVVAVAGVDNSISLYTLEHQSVGDVSLLANLFPFKTLRGVHDLQMTGLALSHFVPPAAETDAASPPPYLALASVSVGNTVAVHHIPLRRAVDRSAHVRQGGPPRAPRYVVALRSRAPSATSLYVIVAVAFLLLSLAVQGLLEVRGLTAPRLGARDLVPTSWLAEQRYEHVGVGFPRRRTTQSSGLLQRLLAERKLDADGGGEGGGRVVLREDGARGVEVATEDYTDAAPGQEGEKAAAAPLPWEDLSPQQKAAWKRKLKAAGHWAEDMGETIFKGILFSELGGAVGAMVG